MEDQLVALLQNINDSTHKAAQIIGGYGSGKSHLLAFLISILADRELRGSIQNELVRRAADELSRDFAVVYWELQPNDVELSEYFYDNLEIQLEKTTAFKLTVARSRGT
jgi:ABC-type cobalamin/Fe3+-siderophores transport system ATPase subunit